MIRQRSSFNHARPTKIKLSQFFGSYTWSVNNLSGESLDHTYVIVMNPSAERLIKKSIRFCLISLEKRLDLKYKNVPVVELSLNVGMLSRKKQGTLLYQIPLIKTSHPRP